MARRFYYKFEKARCLKQISHKSFWDFLMLSTKTNLLLKLFINLCIIQLLFVNPVDWKWSVYEAVVT
jgi:hypothetical protein